MSRTRPVIARPDVAQTITDLILEKIEQGTAPWLKPWSASSTRPLRHQGIPYAGINSFFLWAGADTTGYTSPFWMTYRQASELGGQVRKGESGSFSVYYNTARKSDTDQLTGETTEKTIRFMKWNHVFNASQIDGLPTHYYPEPPDPRAIGELSASGHPRAAAIIPAGPPPTTTTSYSFIAEYMIPKIYFFGAIISFPTKERSTSGTTTLPSVCW